MKFSILHISDLHRDLSDEINNKWLLDSIENDFNQFSEQTPKIAKPSLCIVTGDLVYGVNFGIVDASKELQRQYTQAEEFLVGLADRLFDGRRDRVIILPGNHDICYEDVMSSLQQVKIPSDHDKKSYWLTNYFCLILN